MTDIGHLLLMGPAAGRADFRRVLVVIIAEEISTALHEGRGVVALESTIISHGLPSDSSARVARQIEAAVREAGAVPATIAILAGQVHIGLDDDALDQIATDGTVVKSSIRDLGSVLAGRVLGATTVASTAYLAHRAGIRVFATGGLGGVHRGAGLTFDESADLPALARTPVALVCAGVKSILDVQATLERLETLSVALVGYRTGAFPGFYIQDSGYAVPWVARSAAEIADTLAARDALGLEQALVVANPIPDGKEMSRELHDVTLSAALKALQDNEITGKDVTPFLLGYFHEHTHGVSLQANIDLVLNNATLAAAIAGALAPAPV
jgi:pseudouridine-5'-phosphate glycosidase